MVKKLDLKRIVVSDPRFENSNLRYLTVKSENIKGRGNISVFIPPGEEYVNLPVVLLLHGVYGSHWSWTHLAGIHLYMIDYINKGLLEPMVLVMPSDGLWGDGSGYLPHEHQNFEQWIMTDVIDALIQSIKEVSIHSVLFIAGNSMGGFGALRLGAKYGRRFKAISGLSAITNAKQLQDFLDDDIADLLSRNLEDLSVLDTIIRHKDRLPKIRFDCGSADPLVEPNRILHERLLTENIPHDYHEFDGSHNWSYWGKHIFDTLIFFNKQL